MNWINKNERMPAKHPEFEGCSKDVMVTDGKSWGHGKYDKGTDSWVYVFVGRYENTSNDITHWCEPPVLPSNYICGDKDKSCPCRFEDRCYYHLDCDDKILKS